MTRSPTLSDNTSRDAYHIKSILSYRYHKADIGIISKLQINDTFNNRAILTQQLMFLIKFMLCICLITSFCRLWVLNSMPKDQKATVWLHFNHRNEEKKNIVKYKTCQYLVFKVSVSKLFKHQFVFQVLVPVSYHFISKGIHP